MENNFTPIIEKINTYNNIALLVHENPDGDAIGSMIALFRALKKLGKNVTAFIESVPSNCEFLLNSIGKEIKLFSDIDFNVKYDLCISLDCGDIDRMGDAKELFKNAHDTACIDHHYTNNSFANANYIDSNAAATGELIFSLLNEMKFDLDDEIATAIYSAVISDTGNFKHNNTTKNTFEIASKLVNYNIDITKISYHLFSETSLNRMKFMGKLLENIEVFLDGKVAMLVARSEDIEKYMVEQSELDGMVDYARYVKGVEVGIFIKPYEDFYKISLRSNGKVDVSSVASYFNGGGHKFAAGCRIHAGSQDEVKSSLLNKLEKVI